MSFSCIRLCRECTGCGICDDIPPITVHCSFCGRPVEPGEDFYDLDSEYMCEDCLAKCRREA